MTVSSPTAAEPRGAARHAEMLRAQAHKLMSQLGAITQRIAAMGERASDSSASTERASTPISSRQNKLPRMTAVIDKERCTCCGLCVDICPEHAITINTAVTIASHQCTGCGSCVNECPNGAISLSNAA